MTSGVSGLRGRRRETQHLAVAEVVQTGDSLVERDRGRVHTQIGHGRHLHDVDEIGPSSPEGLVQVRSQREPSLPLTKRDRPTAGADQNEVAAGGEQLCAWGRCRLEAGLSDAGSGNDFGDDVTDVAQMHGVFQLGLVHNTGPTDSPTLTSGDHPGICGALHRIGAFHLSEQGEHDCGPVDEE